MMVVSYIETVVQRIGHCQVKNIVRLTTGYSQTVVQLIAREWLHESGRVRIVCTELYTVSHVLYRRYFSKKHAQYLILLVCHRIIVHPFNRINRRTGPSTVGIGCQWTVGIIRIPVRKHEAAGRDGRWQTVTTLIGLLHFFIGNHGIGTHFQPVAGFYLCVGTNGVTAKRRALSNTILIVETSWNEIVQAFGGAVDRKVVVL